MTYCNRCQREHAIGLIGCEQPTPEYQEGVIDIQTLVMQDVAKRRAVGIERYGTPLQAHNGRDALQDAYDEALDLVMYLRQMIEERSAVCAAIRCYTAPMPGSSVCYEHRNVVVEEVHDGGS
jgi:hypothetical protein